MRGSIRFAFVVAVAPGCGDAEGAAEGESESEGEPAAVVSVSGHAFVFTGGRIAGATVRVLEDVERMTTTGEDGAFGFDELARGREATFVLDDPEWYPIQTGTFTLGDQALARVTFQAVSQRIFDAFAAILGIEPDPARCQIASTVTRVGRSIYDEGAHGEAGATVTIEPPLPNEAGPVYFNASVLPDRDLVETSEDGGVVYANVPPGRYVLTAHKEGVVFTQVAAECRAGVLVNASPPWGLQALP